MKLYNDTLYYFMTRMTQEEFEERILKDKNPQPYAFNEVKQEILELSSRSSSMQQDRQQEKNHEPCQL